MAIRQNKPDSEGLLEGLPSNSKLLADMAIKIALGIISYVILYFSAEGGVIPFYVGVFVSLTILFSLLIVMNKSIIELASNSLENSS